jgi:hypothetical protein
MGRVETAAEQADRPQLAAWQQSTLPIGSATAAVLLTLAVVFVMVVKPTLW